ncbi:MAG: hypothetical protein WC637_05705 [Victivallales bacterium]|jgi:N-acetylglucosamine-6-phosphate deacetylase
MCKNSYKGITLDGKAVEVTVQGGKISGARDIKPESGLPYLLPPLVDLQHNGALGLAYNNLNGEAPKQLRHVADFLIRNGVGRVLATFPTAPYEVLNNSAAALKSALDSDAELDSLFFGIFHEGVFISPEAGWRGGHDPAYILAPDWKRFRILNDLSGNRVKLVNVAPEEPGAQDFIGKAVSAGLKVAIGHCCPETAVINEAVKRGASMVTHFANGAAVLIHRFKNPLWGFLDNEKLSLGLIGDGFHLPPELVRAALRIKGQDRCFMVSDANMYSGCRPGPYKRLGGMDCVIEPGGFIHLADRDILAGAWFQNNRSVEFLVNSVGLNFAEAWKMCSVIPARLMNLRLPALQAGDEATFVQATFCDGKLNIEQSVFCGKEYVREHQDAGNVAFNPEIPEAEIMAENKGSLK